MATSPPQSADLRHRVIFERPSPSTGAGGVTTITWKATHTCRAQYLYQRGAEPLEGAQRKPQALYKLRIRASSGGRAITPDWRARDPRSGVISNILEVDPISDPDWIYILIQSGREA